jgi:hypothetical protein
MPNNLVRRPRKQDKAAALHSQAQRARQMAAECGSALVADLYALHAELCERNAEGHRGRKRKRKPA